MRADEYESRDDENPFFSDPPAAAPARDAGGRTPLYHAAEHGRLDGVVCLCAAGAGSAADGSGKTPAHVAAARGDADALSVMGFYGLDLNGVDGSGATPLEAAASRDAVDAVEQLVLAERVPVRDAEALAAAREGRSFWSARCARSNAGYGDGAPVLACPTVPREPRCAWPISERGPLNASLCPRRWAIATAVLAALYATFVTSSGASLGTVEALALVALVSTAAGSYCYYVAATADPGLLRDEPAARKAYAAALAALARDGDAARRSPVVLHHRAKVAGPPRSKFDASTRGVVLDFDHYCVFLRRPVGRGNYGAFLGVVAFAFVACAALVAAGAAAAKHADRESATWDVLVAVYFGCFALLWGQLLLLHAYLALRKVLTFEALALGAPRAAYLDAGAMPKTPSPTLLDDVGLRLAPRVVIDPKPVSLAEILAEMTRVKEDAEAKRLQRVEKRREKRREERRVQYGSRPVRHPQHFGVAKSRLFDSEGKPARQAWTVIPLNHHSLNAPPEQPPPRATQKTLTRPQSAPALLRGAPALATPQRSPSGSPDRRRGRGAPFATPRGSPSGSPDSRRNRASFRRGFEFDEEPPPEPDPWFPAIKLRRRDAAFEDSDDDIHDLAHNALAHQVPGGLAPAARRKSMVISASAPALGALAAASG
ncbi:hypothetical protein JL720_4235 [Aureococcus anophagefferens]|nr:hypothetical protein JL720_4235 [Aureococcus anophagefferens]